MLLAAQILVSLATAGWLLLLWRGHRLPDGALLRRGAPPVLLAGAVWTLPGGDVLEKCLGRLAMPAGLLWLALITASVAAWYRDRPRATGLLFALWIAYTATGSPWIGGALLAALEAPYDVDPLQAGPFDAVFVLGGGTTGGPGGQVQLSRSGDRVALGARMYHAGRTDTLVSSGETIPGRGYHHDAARATERIWRQLGVPADAIVTIDDVHNTSEEIAAYAALARERDWTRIGLVSSAAHLRRVMQRAGDEGLAARPLPADRRGDVGFGGWLSVIPSGEGFALVHRACWELLGAAVGR